MDNPNIIKMGDDKIELIVDDSLSASVLRAFTGVTPMDAEVDALPVPANPMWLKICINLLRWYRRIRPYSVGHRCVFDPSCSRYSELAFRRLGFFRGVIASMMRLHRCRPGSGGKDIP